MSGFFGATGWFILILGVLVTFHEFGHFWVARRCGVKVLRFSVGFGRVLWSREGRDGTRYQVALIPLGGFVQMLDERETEVAPADRERAFNRKPVHQRIAIVIAGPLANLLLCIGLLWSAYLIGWPDLAPIIGQPSGLAAEAGLQQGDRLLSVGSQQTPSWTQAITPLVLAAIDHQPVSVTTVSSSGATSSHVLRLDRLPQDFDQGNPLAAMGLSSLLSDDLPVVGVVAPDSPAEGQLKPGDRIVRIGTIAIAHFSELPDALQKETIAGRQLAVAIERAGQSMILMMTPRQVTVNSQSRWQLGVGPQREMTLMRYGPIDAFRAALVETGKQSREMMGFLRRLVTGQASSKNLSGVIGIAQVAHSEARLGVSRLLFFMASLSLTLCIMNLLPIPVLDGGHLLYYLIELVSGRPVSDRVLIAGQYVGLALLAGLISLAFYNDIVRTIS